MESELSQEQDPKPREEGAEAEELSEHYETLCNYPDCRALIQYTNAHFDSVVICPTCGRETWVSRPNLFKIRLFRFFQRVFWGFVAAIKYVLQILDGVVQDLVAPISSAVAWAGRHFIGLIGVLFIVGTLLLTLMSPVITASNVFLNGEGFGFVLVALDVLINQRRR
jgi:hypothetical protein